MSFTVEDFHDLIELLGQHPEWRAELRRHVLSDELLELPSLVRQLVEAQVRTETRLRELADAQARAEARLEGVEIRLDRLDAAVQTLVESQTRTEARLDRIDTRLDRIEVRLGDVDGEVLEHRYAHRGPAYFGRIARRLHVIESGPLSELLDDAVDEVRLTVDEREAILLADVVLVGRRDGQDVYLVVEVSGGIGPYDVERAVERASMLEKLGRPTLPVVAGRRGDEATATQAYERGVWYVLGGRVIAPRGA